jgi:hypothetical protein
LSITDILRQNRNEKGALPPLEYKPLLGAEVTLARSAAF